MSCLLVCDDLFFSSKITGTAQAVGLSVAEASTQDAAITQLEADGVRLVIIDLNMSGLDLTGLMSALPDENRPTVIAFDSHVNTQRIQAAKEAGCDLVLPRSRFSTELAALLREYAAVP